MERYQFKAQKGDLVKLPNGKLGVVKKVEVLCAGGVLEVIVFPLHASFWQKIAWFFLGKHRFYDIQVNVLRKIGQVST